MLYLVKGRAGSGKTAYLRIIIKKDVCVPEKRPMLIVHKQFSFESERTML